MAQVASILLALVYFSMLAGISFRVAGQFPRRATVVRLVWGCFAVVSGLTLGVWLKQDGWGNMAIELGAGMAATIFWIYKFNQRFGSKQ